MVNVSGDEKSELGANSFRIFEFLILRKWLNPTYRHSVRFLTDTSNRPKYVSQPIYLHDPLENRLKVFPSCQYLFVTRPSLYTNISFVAVSLSIISHNTTLRSQLTSVIPRRKRIIVEMKHGKVFFCLNF